MNHRTSRPVAICLAALALCMAALCAHPAAAQQPYRNIVNQRFHTISNGPQSAVIVDVANPDDEAAVRRAVTQQMAAVNQARLPGLQREIAFLRKHGRLKPNQSIPIVDTVLLRHNGRLVLPAQRHITRGPGPGNSLNFVISTDVNNNGFNVADPTTAQAVSDLGNLVNTLKTELTSDLGPPLWSGTVTILNKDDNPTLNSGILGITVVVGTNTVTLDVPGSFVVPGLDQNEVLGMAQAMAQAWHGPLAIGYDAWEKGMARAVAVIAAQHLQANFQNQIDPSNSFFYTPYYDLENQPSLGNNKFVPTGWTEQTLSGLGGMLAPRLAASGTAWLKCYIENSNFFIAFNSAYYDAYTADPTVALDSTRLQALAGTAVGPNVEGQPFSQWFQQQYVFDTSVIPGPKLYVNVIPTPPTTTTTDDGVALALLYYQTDSSGNETPLNGTASPVYLDYTYTARLTLPGGDPQVAISAGQGDTGPLFNGIGSAQRITIDIPVDNNYQRIVYPALESTSGSGNSLVYNDFFGVVVGSNSGTLTASFGGGNGTQLNVPVTNGSFGAVGGAAIPNNFTKAMFSYQPTSGGQPITYQRNVYERKEGATLAGVQNIFVFTAPAVTDTLNHVFQPGPALISLPIKPLNPDLAAVFGTSKNATLLAQYRQNAPANPDNYLRYPSLPLYQPGYAMWSDFQAALNGPSAMGVPILGERTDNQTVIEVSLQYGWNLIADPFNTPITILSDGTSGSQGGMTIQYLNGDAVLFSDAVKANWVGPAIYGYDSPIIGSTLGGSNAYVDITTLTSPSTTQFTANTLEPWKGYWILVTVTEGVTLSYINPSPNTRAVTAASTKAPRRAVHRAVSSDRGAWRLPLMLQDEQGHTAYAAFGQSSSGSDNYVSSLDAAMPPAFTRAAAIGLRFPHPEWNSNTGTTDYLSDIRRSNANSTWNVTVDLPTPQKTYALAWSDTAKLPRGTRLTMTDMTTGTTQLMNTTTRYAFTPNQGETSRSFQITAEPRGLSQIAIMNLRVDTPRLVAGRAATSATISYEATGVAEATIQIRGGSGRVVRHLLIGRSVTSGVNQAVWDLKDDQGRGLSAGTYIIEVEARTPEGRQTRAIVTHQVIR